MVCHDENHIKCELVNEGKKSNDKKTNTNKVKRTIRRLKCDIKNSSVAECVCVCVIAYVYACMRAYPNSY